MLRSNLVAALGCLLAPGLVMPGMVEARPAPTTTVAATAAVGDIPFASAHAGNIQVPSAANAWGGARGGDAAPLSDEVTRYVIDARLDPAKHAVDAHQHMTWRNRSDRLVRKVYFHLYLNAFEGPGSTFATESRIFSGSGYARGGSQLKRGEHGQIVLQDVRQNGQVVKWRFVHPDHGPQTDHTVVEFDLPQPVAAHATLSLDIDFHDQLPRVVARTGWWGDFHLVAQWFPKIGVLELPGERGAAQVRWNVHELHFHSEFYADYGSYDVRLTVPKGYTVGAVGQEIGAPVANGGEVTHHFVQHDVEDFAWLAAPGYQTRTTTWAGHGSPKVTVRVIYPPEYAASAEPVLKATAAALTYFSKTLGPYPYRTVTAVVPPYNAGAAGGMEYPTFFTVDGYASITPGTFDQYKLEYVTIHEFGHGYFMGILGSNEFEEPMLDEGMNTYWDDRMLAAHGQRVHATTQWLRWFGIDPTLSAAGFRRLFGVLLVGQPNDSLDSNSWDRISNLSYGSVYFRTDVTMHDLEAELGASAMAQGMRLYYQRWKFRHPSAADLRDALAQGSGQPTIVDRYFKQQVWDTARVDDRVVSIRSTERAASTDAPQSWHTVVTVARDGAPVPQTLRVSFADGSAASARWDDGSRWQRFSWDKPVKAVSAELDPQHKIYLDDNKINDSRTLEANTSLSRRWTSDLSALAQALLALLETL